MHVDRNVAVYRQTVLDALREVEDQLVALRILTEQQAALEAAVTASRLHLNVPWHHLNNPAGSVNFAAATRRRRWLTWCATHKAAS